MIKRNGEIHWYTPKLCLIRQRVQLTDDSLPVEINTNATTAPGRTARWYRLSSFYYPFLSVMKNWSEILADVSESPSESVSTMLCVKHPLCLMSLTKIRILRSPKCLRCDTQMTLHPSWRDESAPHLSLKICLANPLCGSFRVKKYIDCRRFRVSLGFGQSRPHGGILLSCWIESFHTLPHFYHVQWSWC